MTNLIIEETSGVALMRFAGPLSAAEVVRLDPQFRKAAMTAKRRIVIDLAGVPTLATPALTLFLGAMHYQKANGGKVVFTGTSGPIQKLLRVCKLDLVMTIVPDPQAAMTEAAS